MQFVFAMDGNRVVSCSTASDGGQVEVPEGLDARIVSFNDYQKYDEVMGANGTKYLSYNTQTEAFDLLDTPAVPATIDKTTMAANGIEIATVSNLPNPSDVCVGLSEAYRVTDGVFEFSVDTPGSYKIKCWSPYYLEKEFTVNAS
jgi:hypothetical protein